MIAVYFFISCWKIKSNTKHWKFIRWAFANSVQCIVQQGHCVPRLLCEWNGILKRKFFFQLPRGQNWKKERNDRCEDRFYLFSGSHAVFVTLFLFVQCDRFLFLFFFNFLVLLLAVFGISRRDRGGCCIYIHREHSLSLRDNNLLVQPILTNVFVSYFCWEFITTDTSILRELLCLMAFIIQNIVTIAELFIHQTVICYVTDKWGEKFLAYTI